MLKYQSFTKSWYSRGTIALQHLLWCLVMKVQTPPAPLPQFTRENEKRKKKLISNNFEPRLCELKSTYFSKIPTPLNLLKTHLWAQFLEETLL